MDKSLQALSNYIESKEKQSPRSNLLADFDKTTLQTENLLQASDTLHSAYAAILEKMVQKVH